MDSRVPEIRKHLKKKLDAYRYEHTLGVEFTCQALAMRYGYDLDKADLAGLLHDSAKRFEDPVMLQKCLDRNIPVTDEEERDPSLLHAKLGAWMAEHKYEVDDPEILSAITCHTTGKPGMSLLDKILYVADYIEPRRSKAANLTAMRKLAFIDLDEACLEIMESILVYLKSTGCQIDPMTEAACEDMRRVVSERKKETAGEASAGTGITHQDKEEQSVESVKRNGKTCSRGFGGEKGEDVKIIDIEGVSVIADYFVLASASNVNQTQALVDNVEEKLFKAGYECHQKEGSMSSTWVLMDYGDVIVHVFSKEDRLFYDLERIWRDGKIVESVDEL